MDKIGHSMADDVMRAPMIQRQATSCPAKRFGRFTICTTIFINLLTMIGVNQVNLVGQVAKIGAMDSLPEETEVAEIYVFDLLCLIELLELRNCLGAGNLQEN